MLVLENKATAFTSLHYLVCREPLHGGCKNLVQPKPSPASLFGVRCLHSHPRVVFTGWSVVNDTKSCGSGSWPNLEWIQVFVTILKGWRINFKSQGVTSLAAPKWIIQEWRWGSPHSTINNAGLEHSQKNQRGDPQLAKCWSHAGSGVCSAFSSKMRAQV